MGKFENPFTIRFGGDADLFFGRKEQLRGFDNALLTTGSDYRASFITGIRGMGKTSLLEQFSRKASKAGWEVIDAQPEEALKALRRRMVPYDEMTRTTSINPTVTTPFGGGSPGEKSSEKKTNVNESDFSSLFLNYCEEHPDGICVTIDEIQKMNLEDLSLLCGAFQMASRKGHAVILAIAGLPTSYKSVVSHEGCTYMTRANHIQLGLFSREEVEEALRCAFGLVKGLSLDEAAFEHLVNRSKGQPYMMQLLGYFAVDLASTTAEGKSFVLSEDDVEVVFSYALRTYEQRLLQPLVSEFSNGDLAFLKALAKASGQDRRASISDIAAALGKATSAVSMTRARLLEEGLIDASERGKVRFAVPYLREYLLREPQSSINARRLDEWDI